MSIDGTDPTTGAEEQQEQDGRRRYYRLRTPAGEDGKTTPVSLRVTPGGDLYLAVGSGGRRMYLTPDEAWAAWRCLSEAVASLGAPPDWIRTHISPSSR